MAADTIEAMKRKGKREMIDTKTTCGCGHPTAAHSEESLGCTAEIGEGKVCPCEDTPARYIAVQVSKPPYTFAVHDSKENRDLAFTTDQGVAEGYADQMNTQGYIEV